MRAFVTGATGFIGSAVVQELLGAGHGVIGPTSPACWRTSTSPPISPLEGMRAMSHHTAAPLVGRTIVILGGSSGMGLAVAAAAKAAGATPVIAGRSADRLAAAAECLGGAATAVADIADESAVDRLFAGLAAVDHVFIAAGSRGAVGAAGTDLPAIRRAIDERLLGPLHVVRAALPLMAGGSLTLTTGLRAERPAPGMAMATALGAGVEGLVRALALELAPIRVNAVSPGWVDTPLVRGALGDGSDAVLAREAARLPARRIGQPEDVAQAVLFLMTNPYMTGEILHIDGGGRLV